MTDHIISMRASEWHRTQQEINELADAYSTLYFDVLMLLVHLEQRGVVDGTVHDELTKALEDSRKKIGGGV